jgi:hypothetical protein
MTEKMKARVSALLRGSFVVVVDDGNRENEGALIIAAEHVTRETLAFMRHLTQPHFVNRAVGTVPMACGRFRAHDGLFTQIV